MRIIREYNNTKLDFKILFIVKSESKCFDFIHLADKVNILLHHLIIYYFRIGLSDITNNGNAVFV